MSELRTCHVCRYKLHVDVCDFCGHLVCDNCCLGTLDEDTICEKCMADKSHRSLRP